MKLLVVFLSALVLVAHGNVTPSDEEDSVYEVQSDVVAGYAFVAGQEAGGPQDVFAEKVPVVQAFGAEKEQEPAAENVPLPETGVYIPIDTRACNNGECANMCRRLGFRSGTCRDVFTCQCFK